MVIIPSNSIKNICYADVLYELHKVEDKIRLLKNKYNLSFEEFEDKIQNLEEENFEYWDDYIEWKAYTKSFKELIKEKEYIKNGDFKLS